MASAMRCLYCEQWIDPARRRFYDFLYCMVCNAEHITPVNDYHRRETALVTYRLRPGEEYWWRMRAELHTALYFDKIN